MKKTILVLFSQLLAFTIFSQGKIDITHYSFEINLSDSSDLIQGRAQISFKALSDISLIELDLITADANGKGMSVTQVQDEKTKLPFTQRDNKVSVIFPDRLKAGDEKHFFISYQGIPADGLIISKNKYGDRTFFADNWPDRAHNWIPCVDNPADKASFDFTVTAPNQYEVISNGFKTEEKILPDNRKLTHWVEDISLSTKVMVIGVAKFAIKQFPDSPPDIPVSAWVYPQDSVNGFRNYSAAPSILKFFSDLIAPYPYNKLANVQSTTIFGGMENASSIFYDESSASSSRPVESLLAHEITHQWFGDMASEKSFAHLWLSEGFATYFEHYYTGFKYGKDKMVEELKADRNQVIGFARTSDRPVVDSVTSLMGLLNANSYQKGGWVLHMLSRELGDSLFLQCIRAYYQEYKGKNASTDDLKTVIERVSGKNMEQFFQQWLYTPGIPILNIVWKYDDKQEMVGVNVEQTQSSGPFQFPLEIAIDFNGNLSQIEKINVSKKSENFSFPVKARPRGIVLDPNTSLLFISKGREER